MKLCDGPITKQFQSITIRGKYNQDSLAGLPLTEDMRQGSDPLPKGRAACYGLPFQIGNIHALTDKTASFSVRNMKAEWLVFMHVNDVAPIADPFTEKPFRGDGRLNELVALYCIVYADGDEETVEIRRRHQIGTAFPRWGENCFCAVPFRKPFAFNTLVGEVDARLWGNYQFGVDLQDRCDDKLHWMQWLYAWENPHPEKEIVRVRMEPLNGLTVLSGLTMGNASSNPLRWRWRRKLLLKLPKGTLPALPWGGEIPTNFDAVKLDLGQIISVTPSYAYSTADWNNPDQDVYGKKKDGQFIVEYTSHKDACFHFPGGKTIAVRELETKGRKGCLEVIEPSHQQVKIEVRDKKSGKVVPVRLHVHGEKGEYLAPVDRHRNPNPHWFQDYGAEQPRGGIGGDQQHYGTYIDGSTIIDLPIGKVWIEMTKGYEIKPVRVIRKISPATKLIRLTVQKVLPWRERGWVTADTHVHFLSPQTAHLEGAAEGINVVNLLASQWGELMTNAGDFDGKSTFGSKETGGDGEHLVRVGTENRQHVMGHISLLGYEGEMIRPMCSGGPDESALGDPTDVLLSTWARQCREQNGLVIIPHFPNPRAENAAVITNNLADGIELFSWGPAMDPYAIADWYRYLNSGYHVPCVGGTDKMSAVQQLGSVRTYARLQNDEPFSYDAWKKAIRRGDTFVSQGALLDFTVDGNRAGSTISMKRNGGTVDVEFEVACCTRPMSSVELIVCGETVDAKRVGKWKGRGCFTVSLNHASWVAIRIRGLVNGEPDKLLAHSSAVFIKMGKQLPYSEIDAVTIIEQIEGAMAYLDTIGTRAETAVYKKLRLELISAHRKLHNKMHAAGHDHKHTVLHNHAEHRRY